MTDFRQKQGDAAAADIEFCRGLEELFRGHLGGCMNSAFASCSSGRDPEEDEDAAVAAAEGPDQLARRRRRADLDGEDPAESSAARRRQSRILSRWVARQAEEMITTIERRNRESELLALAGLHAVSVLNSPFLRETRQNVGTGGGGGASAAERPGAARAFSILQRWRDLEDDSAGRQRGSLVSNRNRNGPQSRVDTSRSEGGRYSQWSNEPSSTTTREGDDEEEDRGSSREQSPDLGEGEGERVRQIVRGWMAENAVTDPGSRVAASRRNESPGAELLGETERGRVRVARDWVQRASQHRDARVGRREERDTDEDQRSRDGSVTDQEEGHPEHIRRNLPRLRGRQAWLDLFTRIAREREGELRGLSEHRAVSDFAHRNRIQSILRGRFLRNGMPTEEHSPPSVAIRELGQLRQRRPVSGLREGFRFRLENIVRDQVSTQSHASSRRELGDTINDESQEHIVLETRTDDSEQSQPNIDITVTHQFSEIHQAESENNIFPDNEDRQESAALEENLQEETQDESNGWRHSFEVMDSEWNEVAREESNGTWQENMDHGWVQETPGTEDGEGSHLSEEHYEWHLDSHQETIENWEEGISDPISQQSESIRSANRFILSDDDNVYSMELRDLLRRRSVSNLLQSGFRDSLDHLIQSYIQRQGRSPIEWDLQADMPPIDMEEEDHAPEGGEVNDDGRHANLRSPLVLPLPPQTSPPLPPPPPVWHQDMHSGNWDRHGLHQTEIEWEIINDLRADMAKLQQDMSRMQRMLEACMDMQLELQRSVRQEVSAALNRAVGGQELGEEMAGDGSKWALVRKGMCCICCDSLIDSLLYRCGHMCTCAKCASELIRNGGNCPLCRAPIAEVIRAYSLQ